MNKKKKDKKDNNSNITTTGREGNYIRKIGRMQAYATGGILFVTFPKEQTTKLGFNKGDYVKVTNDGHNRIIIEKIADAE